MRKTIIAIPPGATIKEQLVDRGINQKEFAKRMDLTEKHISRLINGEVTLMPDIARRLESVLGIPAIFWLNLSSIYEEKKNKLKNMQYAEKEYDLLKKIPNKEMEKYGWIQKSSNKEELVRTLRNFFEISDLNLLLQSDLAKVLCRRQNDTEHADYALMAFNQQARIKSRDIVTSSISIDGLKKAIPEIKKMTKEKPTNYYDKLSSLLAKNGIALVFLPHIKGSFLNGDTFLYNGKIVLGITIRGSYADGFWFSLFHELGHIVCGHVYSRENDKKTEEEADNFARETLISTKKFNDFFSKNEINQHTIMQFADSEGIDKGIVVGRLQKERKIDYNQYNSLKTRYCLIKTGNSASNSF